MSEASPGSDVNTKNLLLESAKYAIDNGFLVFPIEYNAKNKFFGDGWQEKATQNLDIVQGWFDRYGVNINLGIVPRHGFVIDWDSPDFGSLLTGIAKHCTPDAAATITQALYNTYRVKTPRGGYHAYFKMPAAEGEHYPRQYTHNHPHLKELDTRVDTKGYVVAAGSQINRQAYSRVSSDTSILEAPPALLQFLRLQSMGKGAKKNQPREGVGSTVDGAGEIPVDDSGQSSIKYIPLEEGTLKLAIDAFKASQPGARNAKLFEVACKLFDKRYHRDEVYKSLVKAAREHGLTQREAQITVNSAWTKVTRKLLGFPRNAIVSDIKSNALYAFEELLEFLHLDFRFNVRSQVIEYVKTDTPSHHWDAWDDELRDFYIARIAQACVRRVYSEKHGEAFVPVEITGFRFMSWVSAYARQKEVDPFLDYIMACYEKHKESLPNGILSQWIDQCFQYENTELDQWISTSIICAAVQRALMPGSKWDIMPVLYGTGGAGKSTMLKYLFPVEYRHEWSTDTVDFSMSNKDLVGIMIPTVFAEAQELKGLSRADRRHEKQVLSTHVDRIRLPYARRAGLYPRRSIIIGTTDDVDSLPRDSNKRRYAVSSKMTLRKSLTDILKYMDSHRDQIWAVGYHIVQVEETWSGFIPDSLKQEQESRNVHMQVSEDALESRLSQVPCNQEKGVLFTVLKLYANMDIGDRELYSDARLRDYIKVAKWTKKRVRPVHDQRDKMVTWYFPPKENSHQPPPCDKQWDCCLVDKHNGHCMDEREFSVSLTAGF